MKIQCPHCGVKGSADESYHGQKVKCPKCHGVFPALPSIAETPPTELVQSVPLAEESAEPGESLNHVLDEHEPEVSDQLLDVTDDILEVDIGSQAEDLSDIFAANEAPADEQLQEEVNAPPDAEEEDVLVWEDIASDIDKEMAEGAKREKEQEGDPASLNDFFEDAAPAGDEPPVIAAAAFYPGLSEEPGPDKNALDGVEHQPYGMDKEQCWQCGKKDSVGVPFIAQDGRLYCPDCVPVEQQDDDGAVPITAGFTQEDAGSTDVSPHEEKHSFTIGGLLKEAWAKTKGVKATVWAGSAVMYLTLIILVACGAFLLPYQENKYDGINISGVLGDVLFQLITNAVSVIFSAGLIFIGIRKVAGENVTWKMVFEGFSVAGKLIVATILQTILVSIGILLLVLPGIYLAIGYAMTIPLIVDRKMSPWQAMETSRKAIHGEWWKMFGLFIVMGLISLVSMVPIGIGLIWTWPMFVVLGGVVYRSFFGIEKRVL
ncbi:MAG: hypothetical protein KJ630_12640 [Proteobacteria bacterium]|nr:hypothetical protein [Pseudomonadota bacterium]